MISSIGSSTPSYIPPTDPGGPSPDADSDSVSLTPDALSSFCENALSGIDAQISTLMSQAASGDDPTAMIQLQSLVSDRQEIVTMATNLVAAFAATTQAEVQNIGRQ